MSYLQQLHTIVQELSFSRSEYTFLAEIANQTWFKVGGRVDLLIHSSNISLIEKLLVRLKKQDIPSFFLGDGSNVVISDAGIAGVVIDTKLLTAPPKLSCPQPDGSIHLTASAGTLMEELVLFTVKHKLEGMTHFYGLPGTLGGAVFMNARCYEGEIADLSPSVQLLYADGSRHHAYEPSQWHYKHSPFQTLDALITEVTLKLTPSLQSDKELLERAQHYKQDRQNKGHFNYPCAGSTFKNNRLFGKPSGKIIDECNLKGVTIGGASVADFHGNIIINKNQATASDIYALSLHIQQQVQQQTGYLLEPEILFIGRGYTQPTS